VLGIKPRAFCITRQVHYHRTISLACFWFFNTYFWSFTLLLILPIISHCLIQERSTPEWNLSIFN
jgi:hypothetical protein